MKNFIISHFEDNVMPQKTNKQTTDESHLQYTNSDGIIEISVAFSRKTKTKIEEKNVRHQYNRFG